MSTTADTKNAQTRNAIIVGGVFLLITIIVIVCLNMSSAPQKVEDKLTFDSPIEKVKADEIWRERLQNKINEAETKTKALQDKLTQLQQAAEVKGKSQDVQLESLHKENQLLEETLKNNSSNPTLNMPDTNQKIAQNINAKSEIADDLNNELSPQPGIDDDELNLKQPIKPTRNPDTFVPTGTFAQAVMLGAADASTSVQSEKDATPMLFRIIADGTLPNHHRSHLKDCVLTANVFGDISSERGIIRLERLSCTFPSGKIVDQKVEGTIFGLDAKNGVRGRPLWREGALLGRAAVAGSLSGFGNAISQSFTTNSISPLGATQTVNNGDIFKFGLASGASNAMEKLADYNIKRAELYHPVIQLSAGQVVDVVFMAGFYLDGHWDEQMRRDDEMREVQINNEKNKNEELFTSDTNNTQSLTLSADEMQKLKKHEKEIGL